MMKTAQCSAPIAKKAQQGFTLVELITIIILLGVLTLAVAPRFSDRSGYAEFALQKRLLSALRNIQLKAMNDTRNDFCYRMIFTHVANGPIEFGPTTASYLDGQQTNACDTSIDSSSEAFMRSESGEIANEDVSMVALDGNLTMTYLQFDNLGRPTSNNGSCASLCTVTFSGESDARICVVSEGYIYAC